MNNYWDTNYAAGQGGDFTFRYIVTSGRNLDAACALGRDSLTHRDLQLLGIFFNFTAGFADAAVAALAALEIGNGF